MLFIIVKKISSATIKKIAFVIKLKLEEKLFPNFSKNSIKYSPLLFVHKYFIIDNTFICKLTFRETRGK